MDPAIGMGTVFNVKRSYAILLKFGDKFLTSLTKLVIKVKYLL